MARRGKATPLPDAPTSLRHLRKVIGTGATRSLQMRCSKLCIWRRSTPHNWFVENKKGQMLWHSSEDRSERALPPSYMFELLKHSKELVGGYAFGIISQAEAGSPEYSEYRLKNIYC